MLYNLKHNQNITMTTLNKFCKMLDCDITDVIKYSKNNIILLLIKSQNHLL